MSLQLAVGDESHDVSYGYWNEFCEWVAEVRPEAASILHKAPTDGSWSPKAIVGPDEATQSAASLLADCEGLSKAEGADAHREMIDLLADLASKAIREGKPIEVS